MSNNTLLDTIITEGHLKNDAALSRLLNLAPPVISKIRHGKLNVSGDTIIRIHEEVGMSIARIKHLVAEV